MVVFQYEVGFNMTQQMDIVAIRLKTAILSSATDLQLQAYWLSTSLALGAFLRVRSIGKRDVGNMFKFGDDMINFVALHGMLAESVADVVVVDVNVLLGQVCVFLDIHHPCYKKIDGRQMFAFHPLHHLLVITSQHFKNLHLFFCSSICHPGCPQDTHRPVWYPHGKRSRRSPDPGCAHDVPLEGFAGLAEQLNRKPAGGGDAGGGSARGGACHAVLHQR